MTAIRKAGFAKIRAWIKDWLKKTVRDSDERSSGWGILVEKEKEYKIRILFPDRNNYKAT